MYVCMYVCVYIYIYIYSYNSTYRVPVPHARHGRRPHPVRERLRLHALICSNNSNDSNTNNNK